MKVKKTLSHFYPKIPKQLYKSFYIAVILILAFATCDLAFLNGNRSYQYSLVDENGNPLTNDIPDDDFFYINLKSAYYTGAPGQFNPLDFILYAMDDGPGTDCKISVNEESGTEDLFCILDVMEGDLWYQEMTLQYNMPAGMCSYLGFLPHWHFNYEVGYGPPYVAQYRTSKVDDNGNHELNYVGCEIKPISRDASCSNIACENQADCENDDHLCNSSYCSNGGCTNEDDCEDTTNSCNDASYCSNRGCENQTDCDNANHDCNGGIAGTWTAGTGQAGTWTQVTSGTWTPSLSTCPAKDQVKDSEGDSFLADTEAEIPEKLCKYAHKEGKDKVINCCLGTYDLHKDGGVSSSEEPWGSNDKNKIGEECIGGLARIGKLEGFSNQTLFDKNSGFPVMLIKESGSEGVKDEYTLTPLLTELGNDQRHSFPTANFFKAIEDDKENPTLPGFYYSNEFCVYNNYILISCQNKKDCENADHSCNGDHAGKWISYGGHPFITWACLDNAKEVKHRINLLIREWNTQEEFSSFKESEGSRGDPDTGGLEGSECDYYEKSNAIFGSCNDLRDADDFGTDYPVTDYPELKYE